LEVAAGLALLVAVLIGVQFFIKRLEAPSIQVARVENGAFKDLQQLVVSDQTNKFAVFASFKNTGAGVQALNWLPFVSGVGTANIFFRWQARSLYGITIHQSNQLTWRRVAGRPGVIDISSPPLSLLETKVGLGREELSIATIEKSMFVREDQKKVEYLPTLQARSEEEAKAGLSSEQLKAVASRVVSHHVMSLINQGASETDKVHTASVVFREK
jgi:hypothetical protein